MHSHSRINIDLIFLEAVEPILSFLRSLYLGETVYKYRILGEPVNVLFSVGNSDCLGMHMWPKYPTMNFLRKRYPVFFQWMPRKNCITLHDASNHLRFMRRASPTTKPTSRRRANSWTGTICTEIRTSALPLDGWMTLAKMFVLFLLNSADKFRIQKHQDWLVLSA